ncbi:hypothetical protein GCM10010464_36000 [Pseudonocardia yunnanensis]|uniref:DUF4352 domain-containing protein n=1 Tax=Pseudonocardia yunnanensis TaxID=58107 RepID=A0ABW4EL61_9PSEU
MRVQNASTRPVFGVEIVSVEVCGLYKDPDQINLGDDDLGLSARVLAPETDFRRSVGPVNPSTLLTRAPAPDSFTIEFADANGLRWRRRDNQAPVRRLTGSTI